MQKGVRPINQKYISKANSIDYTFNLFCGSGGGLKAQSINKKTNPWKAELCKHQPANAPAPANKESRLHRPY